MQQIKIHKENEKVQNITKKSFFGKHTKNEVRKNDNITE